jgi:hypothetical protein
MISTKASAVRNTTSEWVINRSRGTQVPDRWRRDPGISRTILEKVQSDASCQNSLDWRFSKIPEIDAVSINRPELPYTGAGEPVHRSRSCGDWKRRF